MKTEPITEPADPRAIATACALGELTPEERAAFEKECAENPNLESLAGGTKEFCDLLTGALAQPTPELQQAARARLLFEADKRNRSAKIIRHKWMRRVTAAAACLAVGGGSTYWWMAANGKLADRYASQTKFQINTHSAPDVFNSMGADPSTRSSLEAGSAKVAAQITQQEEAVEQSRLAMLDVMKKHDIVDSLPLSSGNGTSGVVPVGTSQPEAGRDYASAKYSYESQLQTLNGMREHAMRQNEQTVSGVHPAPPASAPVPVTATPSTVRPVLAAVGGESRARVGRDFEATTPIDALASKDGSYRGKLSDSQLRTERGIFVPNGGSDGTPVAGVVPGREPVAGEKGGKADFEQLRSGVGGIYLTTPRDEYAQSPVAPGTESYKPLPENPFFPVLRAPLSTFSIDVDTASYSNVRRFLNMGQCPPPEAVRLEELVNYFPYDYGQPVDGKPFAVHVEMTSAPWNASHRVARIALKGKEIAQSERPAANLVFLVDVSGSMNETNKLPLVKQSLKFVVERLTEKDTVSMVTYAGESGVALPVTNGAEKQRIIAAIDGLGAGGSTNGAGGISTAYAQAAQHFNKEGVNRVILATDGDFNVGVTSHEELLKLITEKAKTGVFLSVLGYGMGNTKDDTMELLADKGNGNYAYIDSLSEARKSLADQFTGTLVTIAKDVKIQIEFNPAIVRSYRLLGYENRMLAKEDFNNDKKDAGEIGAGHTVTALYELVPVGAPEEQVTTVDGLKYQPKTEPVPAPPAAPAAEGNGETMTVKLRWKAPDADVSQLMEVPVKDGGAKIAEASPETRWAVAVAGFAALLNNSQYNGLTWEDVRTLAKSSKGADTNGYRGEFLQLLNKAESVRR